MHATQTTRWMVGATMAIAALLPCAGAGAEARRLSDWGDAANAESLPGSSDAFNSPFLDGCPIQSSDQRQLFMATNRPGGQGGIDIWVASRSTSGEGWSAPSNPGAVVNSPYDDFCPTPLRGGHLLFVSSRPGCGTTGADIYITRSNPHHGWEQPENLGCQINSAAGEAGPSLLDEGDRTVLYFSSNRAGGFAPDGAVPDADIYFSVLGGDGTFGPAELAVGVNSALDDARPNVRKDGREIVFDSNRTGTVGGNDIWASSRASLDDPWSPPVNLGDAINTTASETRASLSWDGLTLVFGSNRAGSEPDPVSGLPSNDIYVSTRSRSGGSPNARSGWTDGPG